MARAQEGEVERNRGRGGEWQLERQSGRERDSKRHTLLCGTTLYTRSRIHKITFGLHYRLHQFKYQIHTIRSCRW